MWCGGDGKVGCGGRERLEFVTLQSVIRAHIAYNMLSGEKRRRSHRRAAVFLGQSLTYLCLERNKADVPGTVN